MCEVCELRAKAEKLSEEVEFRILQYQKELHFGRAEDAKDAKEYGMQALADIFNLLDQMPVAMERIEKERETGQGIDSFLSRMFRKDEGQVH